MKTKEEKIDLIKETTILFNEAKQYYGRANITFLDIEKMIGEKHDKKEGGKE